LALVLALGPGLAPPLALAWLDLSVRLANRQNVGLVVASVMVVTLAAVVLGLLATLILTWLFEIALRKLPAPLRLRTMEWWVPLAAALAIGFLGLLAVVVALWSSLEVMDLALFWMMGLLGI